LIAVRATTAGYAVTIAILREAADWLDGRGMLRWKRCYCPLNRGERPTRSRRPLVDAANSHGVFGEGARAIYAAVIRNRESVSVLFPK